MNRLGQSGPTMFQWNSEVYSKRLEAFNWEVIICDGHDVNSIIEAFSEARRSEKPSFIISKTVKGKGVSFLENREDRHGTVLSENELESAEHEILSRLVDTSFQPSNRIHASTRIVKRGKLSLTTNYAMGEMVATRDAYGSALVKLGEQNEHMLVLDGARARQG
jgi:transketolase